VIYIALVAKAFNSNNIATLRPSQRYALYWAPFYVVISSASHSHYRTPVRQLTVPRRGGSKGAGGEARDDNLHCRSAEISRRRCNHRGRRR